MSRYTPQQLIGQFRAIVGPLTDEEFFRRPRHKKTQELWCAAHYSLGFEKFIAPCTVQVSEVDEQTDTDFVLQCATECFPFQITEVIEPGRRRGELVRNGQPLVVPIDENPKGTTEGSSWVRAAIQRKVLKHYADACQLNLLCYINFSARNQQFEIVRAACNDVSASFASVWLLTGNALCCIHPVIPELSGWLVIPETMAHVDE